MNIDQGIISTADLELTIEASENAQLNWANDEEVTGAVTDFVDKKVTNNQSLLSTFWDDLIHYDYMYRCGLNETEKASNDAMVVPEDARANVGATLFFRQVIQSAAKLYSFMTSRDAYWKYSPVTTQGIELSKEESEIQCAQLNSLIKWNLKQDHFDEKLMRICTAVSKDGLAFVGVNWKMRREDRTIAVTKSIAEDGTVETEDLELPQVLVENLGEIVLYDPFSVIVDPNIGDMQMQDCPAVTTLITMGDAVNYVQTGYWDEDQFRKINESHGWDGSSGRPKQSDQEANAGRSQQTTTDSGLMLMWNVWVNLPIGEDGKLDQAKHVPRRHVCTFLGNKISDSVCVRISRNDEPEDRIPLEAIHDYADTIQSMFRISKGRVLKNNFAVETTTVNQMTDGVSLVMNPATIERKGAVISRERKYGRSSRIVVRDDVNNDIREYSVPDRTQTGQLLLDYIKEDSKMAIATDPSQMGEGLGARATATESSGVMRLSAAPSVMNAKYVSIQLFDYLAQRLKVYWQNFGQADQIVQITDTNGSIQNIRPTTIYGDFDVQVDIVDQVVNDILSESKISQDIAMIGANETLSSMMDWEAMMEEYSISRYGKSYVKGVVDADAAARARMDAQRIMTGERVSAEEGQNHAVHLRILRAERIRYKGVEGEMQLQVSNLESLIEQHEQMMATAGGGAPASAPTLPETAPDAAGGGAANMPILPAPTGGQ